MSKLFPTTPSHPERTCWGCDRYCPATSMACGNGSDRTQHPVELFGPDWRSWQPPRATPSTQDGPAAVPDTR